MVSKSRVTILVKAYPQPSKKHAETVCCAGIDSEGNWKRLFPVRFRQLSEEQAFKRWNIISFEYSRPKGDNRAESCRVHEDSIGVVGKVKRKDEKTDLIDRVIVSSEKEAIGCNYSLAAIRPRNVRLSYKRRDASEIEVARKSFEDLARQKTMFDKELAALEPCPIRFTMHYDDADGPHNKTCADWETHATFKKFSQLYGEKQAIEHLQKTYCEDYVKAGLVFALGNIAKRPQTWQLLGIFPVEPAVQPSLI